VPDNLRLRTRRCECGAADCTAEIWMSWEEQDAVDHDTRNLFAVTPGHELTGPEECLVVSRNDRFVVVEVAAPTS
jgi:hypothetical protein